MLDIFYYSFFKDWKITWYLIILFDKDICVKRFITRDLANVSPCACVPLILYFKMNSSFD